MGLPIGWRDDGLGHRASDDVYTRPAKDYLGVGVPHGDQVPVIYGHNSIQGVLQDQAGTLFTLLEVAVQRCVANGDCGLDYKAVQECLILGCQVKGLLTTKRQHGEKRVLEEDGNGEKTAETTFLPPVVGYEVLVIKSIGDVEGAPVCRHPADTTLVEAQLPCWEIGMDGLSSMRFQRLGGLISNEEVHDWCAGECGSDPSNFLQHRVHVQR